MKVGAQAAAGRRLPGSITEAGSPERLDGPLGVELRQRVASALQAVAVVISVDEQDNEKWYVTVLPQARR